MKSNITQNKVHFFTTLSVYLGLVLVGASPQVLAQAKIVKNPQTQSFEINVKTNSVLSKLKYKSDFESKEILPFATVGKTAPDCQANMSNSKTNRFSNLYKQITAENHQVFLVSNFPRASL